MNNLIDVKGLRPFKNFIMSIGEIPTAYSDSMSYYELLNWFCDYLQNQVIPTINNNANAVTELQNLYIELKSYVDNYFNNLDVQEEINNKLDDMTERGQLQEIITEYLNSKAIFAFDNVENMKSANNLIDGSYAKTLGYYAKNDCGGALYKIREITNNDVVDNGSIIPLNNSNLIAELLIENNYINADCFGCRGDGQTNDYINIMKAVVFAREHNLILHFSNKNYLINNTINFDISKDCFKGHNTKIIGNNIELMMLIDNSVYPPWNNTKTIIEDIEFTNLTDRYGTCLNFQGSHDVSHIQIINCNFNKFETALKFFTNSYKINFINCDIWNNDTCILMPNGGSNYGENISFISCCIFNSNYGVINNNANGCIFLTNSSIDYNYCATKTSANSQIKCCGCHIEGHQKFYGNIICDNCEVLFLKLEYENDDNILFNFYDSLENNNYNLMQFNNCYIMGAQQLNNEVTNNNNGVIDFNHCRSISYNGFLSYRYNDLSCVFKGIPLYKTRGGNVTINNDVITFTKNYGGGSPGDLYLFIPVKPGNTRNKVLYDVKISGTGTIYATTSKGCLANIYDDASNSLQNSTIFGTTNLNQENYGDFTQTGATDNSTIGSFKNYLLISFNANQLSANGTIEIRNLKVTDF